MKILLLAPVHAEKEFLQQKGKYPFLKGQGQMGWVQAMEELGQEVIILRYSDSVIIPNAVRVRFETFLRKHFLKLRIKWQHVQDRLYYLSIENVLKNLKIKNLAYATKPDLLILSGGTFCIFPKTIQEIKEKLHIPVLLFSGVNPIYGAPPAEKKMVKKGIIDQVIINDEGFGKKWVRLGAKKVILLPVSAVDSSIYKKVFVTKEEKKAYACDVCFIGSLTPDRQKKLLELTDFNVKIWGNLPGTATLDDRLRPFYQGQAYGEKMVKIYNCAKIVLNIHAAEMKYGGNMRTFEIPATGAFQLIDHVNYEWFVDGKEIVSFKNLVDLKKKIKYYLQHEKERNQIAERGYKKALTAHTYKARFEKLFTLLKNEK